MALVRPPYTTELTDGLCVFPCFAVPHSIIRCQRVKCSSAIPRARATCTAHTYIYIYILCSIENESNPLMYKYKGLTCALYKIV